MMKPLIFISIAILVVLPACKNSSQEKATSAVHTIGATINLPTVKCNMCVATVEKALASLEGIESAEVHLKEKDATVRYPPAKLDLRSIETEISKAGYDANEVRRDSTAYENLPECCK